MHHPHASSPWQAAGRALPFASVPFGHHHPTAHSPAAAPTSATCPWQPAGEQAPCSCSSWQCPDPIAMARHQMLGASRPSRAPSDLLRPARGHSPPLAPQSTHQDPAWPGHPRLNMVPPCCCQKVLRNSFQPEVGPAELTPQERVAQASPATISPSDGLGFLPQKTSTPATLPSASTA